MRLRLLLSSATALCGSAVTAFVPRHAFGTVRGINTFKHASVASVRMAEGSVCDTPEGLSSPDLVSQKGSASILRSAVLTNADGDKVRLGDRMTQGTSVVIFLRHLA